MRILQRGAPSHALPWVALLILVSLWGAARVVPARALVFPAPGQVRLLEADSYFHLRHARTLLQNFPRVQRWDPATHYPRGQRGENQGAYDLLLASAAMAAGLGHPSEATLLRTAAWTPVVLSGLSLVLLYLLSRLLLGPWKGLLPVVLMLFFPGALVSYTCLGFADHHALELLVAVAVCLGVALCASPECSHRVAVACLSLPLLVILYAWPGSALYLALATACLGAAALAGARVHDPALRVGLAVSAAYLVPTALFPDLIQGGPYHRA
ncbi:MAG: STT3 domain-containing protein, partial [Candidatus Eremiobacterota bacterium]